MKEALGHAICDRKEPTYLDDLRKTWENTGNARGKKRVIGNKGEKQNSR